MMQLGDDCVCCPTQDIGCLGIACPYINVPHYYCDECGDEAKLFYFDGQELCINCIEDKLEAVEGSCW